MKWGEKPYYSLDFFLKNKFGCKVAKIPIDAGFTCPNRDGSISYGGCIFCSSRGSGDFTQRGISITEQIERGKYQVKKKWNNTKYIAYFQAYTNTYAPVEELKIKYEEAIKCEDIVGLSIATRPDCINDEVLELLKEFNKRTYLTVELGLQSCNEKTAEFINRGYKNECFEEAVWKLARNKIDIVVHIILGLPNETKNDMMATTRYVSFFPISGVKLQMLYIIKNTPLATYYEDNKFHILQKNEYIDMIIESIKFFPQSIIIHRLTGDGKKDEIIEPMWSIDKRNVINSIHKQMKINGDFQGKDRIFE